jgi:hypothetical protein
VIDSGALPLDVLAQQINEWIAQKAGGRLPAALGARERK